MPPEGLPSESRAAPRRVRTPPEQARVDHRAGGRNASAGPALARPGRRHAPPPRGACLCGRRGAARSEPWPHRRRRRRARATVNRRKRPLVCGSASGKSRAAPKTKTPSCATGTRAPCGEAQPGPRRRDCVRGRCEGLSGGRPPSAAIGEGPSQGAVFIGLRAGGPAGWARWREGAGAGGVRRDGGDRQAGRAIAWRRVSGTGLRSMEACVVASALAMRQK